MLYHSLHVPEGGCLSRGVVSPQRSHVLAGWGRAGDIGGVAVDLAAAVIGAAGFAYSWDGGVRLR